MNKLGMLQRLRVAIKTVQWMSVPLGTNNHTCGTTQPNDAIGGHFNIQTSYKVGKTQLTTDSMTQLPISHSDEDRNKEFTCSQPWSYPKNTTNGNVICECGSALEQIVTMHKWNSVTITSSWFLLHDIQWWLCCILCFIHSDEDRNEEFTCSQPWLYPKKTTNGGVICEFGSTLGRIVQ